MDVGKIETITHLQKQSPAMEKERVKKEDEDGEYDEDKKRKGIIVSGGGGGGGKKPAGSGGLRCCQAEKCTADLSEAKQYHRRHKVCEIHAKSQVVIVGGISQRFCQQCSRLEQISFWFLTFYLFIIRTIARFRMEFFERMSIITAELS